MNSEVKETEKAQTPELTATLHFIELTREGVFSPIDKSVIAAKRLEILATSAEEEQYYYSIS